MARNPSYGSITRSQTPAQPGVSPSEAIALRRAGWRQRSDGTWYLPAGSVGPTADGSTTTTRPKPVPGSGNLSGSGVDNGGGAAGPTPQSTGSGGGFGSAIQRIGAATTGGGVKPSLGGGGGGTPLAPSPNAGTPITGGTGGGTGGLSDQYSANMVNEVILNPELLGRGVLREMGYDEDSGYGAILADDAAAISPLMAFLLAQGGTAGPATTLDSIGNTLMARATPGGAGALDPSLIANILNPTTDAARVMLGDSPDGISDLSPEDQINMVDRYLMAAYQVGMNPYAGNAMAAMQNNAGTAYLDQVATGGPGIDPYYQFLQQRGLAGMWQG